MNDLDKMAHEIAQAHERFGDWGYEDMVDAIRTALLTAPPGYVLVDRAQLGAALDAVRATMGAAYSRRFPECCGSYSLSGCCGNPREAWTKEDQETMDTLHPAEQALAALLAAAPEVK